MAHNLLAQRFVIKMCCRAGEGQTAVVNMSKRSRHRTTMIIFVLNQICLLRSYTQNNGVPKVESKGKEAYLNSATYTTPSLKALRHGPQLYLQITPCLPFLRKRSPDGATPNAGYRHPIAAYYSFIDPEEMKG